MVYLSFLYVPIVRFNRLGCKLQIASIMVLLASGPRSCTNKEQYAISARTSHTAEHELLRTEQSPKEGTEPDLMNMTLLELIDTIRSMHLVRLIPSLLWVVDLSGPRRYAIGRSLIRVKIQFLRVMHSRTRYQFQVLRTYIMLSHVMQFCTPSFRLYYEPLMYSTLIYIFRGNRQCIYCVCVSMLIYLTDILI